MVFAQQEPDRQRIAKTLTGKEIDATIAKSASQKVAIANALRELPFAKTIPTQPFAKLAYQGRC